MEKVKLEIVTPEHTVYAAEVDQVSLPTGQGEITVLPHHIPLVSTLQAGRVKIVRDGREEYMAISSGFIEVQPHRVVVLAQTAERAEEIDSARAQAARDRAQASLKEERLNKEEYAAVASALEKEMVRLRVAERHRERRVTNQVERAKREGGGQDTGI